MRHRFSAASTSLKAIARPALREPAPFVLRVRTFTVAKDDSIGLVVRTLVPQSRRLDEVADSAREIANVRDKLAKRLQPRAKAALHEITPALPQGKCARTGPAECGRGK